MFYEEEEVKDKHKKKSREGNAIWDSVDDDWQCPSCKRGKFQILRKGKDRDVGGLHRHHDHAVEWDDRNNVELTKFQETIICDQCNHAEGMVKKIYPGIIPDDFTFTPEQIGQFVKAKPNRAHRIRFLEALQLFFSIIDLSLEEFTEVFIHLTNNTKFIAHSTYKMLARYGYPPSSYLEEIEKGNILTVRDIKRQGSLIQDY